MPTPMGEMPGAPQDEKASTTKRHVVAWKSPSPQRIDRQVLYVVGWISGTCEHVVPPEYLMQNNPVKEPPSLATRQLVGLPTPWDCEGEMPPKSRHMPV